MTVFTLGVEEEFHLVDAGTGALRPDERVVVGRASARVGPGQVQPELLQAQVETGTPVCSTLAEVRRELVRLRREVAAAAAGTGCRVAASGTYPGAAKLPPVTDKDRYQKMVALFGITAREQVCCGCHVHVALGDRELAVAVLRRARRWLPVLLALGANSPFWHGADTGYASYRSQVWARWPTAGPPPPLRNRQEYDEVVRALLATGVLRDTGMLYWDARVSARYETLEFRVADVGLRVDDAVLLAGLVRALVRACADAEAAGEPFDDVRPELLRVASWRAARFGVDGELVDLAAGRPAPAADVVGGLLNHVRGALEQHGDREEVTTLADAALAGGSGAARQRSAYRRRGRIRDVIDQIVAETTADEAQ